MIPPTPRTDTQMKPDAASGAGARGVCGAAKALGTGSLATFCSTHLLSQQPRCGPPGMGARARSLSWGVLLSQVLREGVLAGGLGWARSLSHLSSVADTLRLPRPHGSRHGG